MRQCGTRWRRLAVGQQALLVLAHLRKGETFAEVAAGFGVGTSTAWRYVNETVAALAAPAGLRPVLDPARPLIRDGSDRETGATRAQARDQPGPVSACRKTDPEP